METHIVDLYLGLSNQLLSLGLGMNKKNTA